MNAAPLARTPGGEPRTRLSASRCGLVSSEPQAGAWPKLPSHQSGDLFGTAHRPPELPCPSLVAAAPVLHQVLSCIPLPCSKWDSARSPPRQREGVECPETTHCSQRRSSVLLHPPGFSKLTCSLLLLDTSTWRNKLSWESRFQLADLLGQGKESTRHREHFRQT